VSVDWGLFELEDAIGGCELGFKGISRSNDGSLSDFDFCFCFSSNCWFLYSANSFFMARTLADTSTKGPGLPLGNTGE